jgi:hypothetical protein
MSQKANIITIRQKNFINITTFNTKIWVSFFNIVEKINRLFFLKGVLVCNHYFSIENNIIFLTLQLFFQNIKISVYKTKIKKKSFNTSLSFLSYNILKLFSNKQLDLSMNKCFLNFKVLNNYLNKEILIFLYLNLKPYVSFIFSRRFNLFIDFLKLTNLFVLGKINLNIYNKFLNKIFKSLSKRSHTKFFSFLKVLFTLLIEEKTPVFSSFGGLKILISGKIQGKDRSSLKLIKVGSVPSQTISKNIEYSLEHVYTLYGVFGLKLWLYKKK